MPESKTNERIIYVTGAEGEGGIAVQRFVSTPLQVVDIGTDKNQSFFASPLDINAYVTQYDDTWKLTNS